MKKPVLLRLDQELIDRIESYRIKQGLKFSAEATRSLIEAGLAARLAEHLPTQPQDVWTGGERVDSSRSAYSLQSDGSVRVTKGDGIEGLQLGPTERKASFFKQTKGKKT
jgi:hypothetical protein